MSLVRQIFLKKDMEVENNKFGYIKKLCSAKDTIKRVKRPNKECMGVFSISTSNKNSYLEYKSKWETTQQETKIGTSEITQ